MNINRRLLLLSSIPIPSVIKPEKQKYYNDLTNAISYYKNKRDNLHFRMSSAYEKNDNLQIKQLTFILNSTENCYDTMYNSLHGKGDMELIVLDREYQEILKEMKQWKELDIQSYSYFNDQMSSVCNILNRDIDEYYYIYEKIFSDNL